MRLTMKSLFMKTQFRQGDFTYTGSVTWSLIGMRWYAKFTSSGVFTPRKTIIIDVFLVGGGNGGKDSVKGVNPGGGGSGGLTGTWRSVVLYAGSAYTITVGAGGASNGGIGGTTSITGTGLTTMSRAGGTPDPSYFYNGGDGGSGGGSVGAEAGGSDGGNGGGTDPGLGQGSTTREFGEAGNTLYAGGGGAGGFNSSGGPGGAGGGGNGGWASYSSSVNPGDPGVNGLGGGGGGAGGNSSHAATGGVGGSGIAIFRMH